MNAHATTDDQQKHQHRTVADAVLCDHPGIDYTPGLSAFELVRRDVVNITERTEKEKQLKAMLLRDLDAAQRGGVVTLSISFGDCIDLADPRYVASAELRALRGAAAAALLVAVHLRRALQERPKLHGPTEEREHAYCNGYTNALKLAINLRVDVEIAREALAGPLTFA
jgi:hypothetical protein